MAGLAEKFTRLKRCVGGNREITSYEETFGQPVDEQLHVTPPSLWQRRILSELGFALTLDGGFESQIESAMDFLQQKIDCGGALTNSDCMEAEAILEPLKEKAQEYSLILAAHAHIDMNWMWGWQETVEATLATFRTMLMLMEEYPEFCFSQSQASVYKIVEDFDPELMEKIQKRIREGRWEITASAWVETDKNMPSAESLLKHIKYTRAYLQEHWGIDPDSLNIDFSPDTFGHSANIPEIDNYGKVKYYYHCRGLDGENALYRWRSPSGRELLMYREQHWYNSGITPHIAMNLVDISRRSGGLKTGLIVYGVGDHGGGATRRDLERAVEMMDWPVFPKIRFGTMGEYFALAESVREKLPLVKGEINYVAPGCYTTQSRIKLGNRKSEKALYEADLFSSSAHAALGAEYHGRSFEKAWQNVLFTHFHDILTGSCVQESREHAMGLLSDSMAVANTQRSNALRIIADHIDTSYIEGDNTPYSQSEGAGVGYGITGYDGTPSPEQGSGKVRLFHVFNSQPQERKQPVEITVWDWPGDLRRIEVTDAAGNDAEFALLDTKMQEYWSHKYFRLLVWASAPGLGYTTVVLREKECEKYTYYLNNPVRSDHPYTELVLENEFIRARFDPQNGDMVSLTDKETGDELLKAGESAGLRFIHTESATSSAWQIGRHLGREDSFETLRIYPVERGCLRQGFYVEKRIKNSVVKENVYLDKGARAVKVELEVDWNETGFDTFVPVLAYAFPHAYEAGEYLFDIPAGSQLRQPKYLDVPGLQYGAAVNPGGKSAAIIADSKYGYRGVDGQISVSLINSSVSPDPYPERGIHKIKLAVGISQADPKALEELAGDVNYPMSFISGRIHIGDLPAKGSLLTFSGESAVLSGVTTADNGGLIVRFYEAKGSECRVSVSTLFPIKGASAVDLMENEIEPAEINGNKASVLVKPYSIGALLIV